MKRIINFFFVFENFICDDYIIEKLYLFYCDYLFIIFVINGLWDVNKYFFKGIFINSWEFFLLEKLVEKLKEIGFDEFKYICYL